MAHFEELFKIYQNFKNCVNLIKKFDKLLVITLR